MAGIVKVRPFNLSGGYEHHEGKITNLEAGYCDNSPEAIKKKFMKCKNTKQKFFDDLGDRIISMMGENVMFSDIYDSLLESGHLIFDGNNIPRKKIIDFFSRLRGRKNIPTKNKGQLFVEMIDKGMTKKEIMTALSLSEKAYNDTKYRIKRREYFYRPGVK